MKKLPRDPNEKRDFIDFLTELSNQRARFAIVGGWVDMAQTNSIRVTKDLDVYVSGDDALLNGRNLEDDMNDFSLLVEFVSGTSLYREPETIPKLPHRKSRLPPVAGVVSGLGENKWSAIK